MSDASKQPSPGHRLINLVEWLVAIAIVGGLCYGAYWFFKARIDEHNQAPRTIEIRNESAREISVTLEGGLVHRDMLLTNNTEVRELRDVDLVITLKNTKNSKVSQKRKAIPSWRKGEIIKIEGFDSGDWDRVEIHGDAKSEKDTVKIDIETELVKDGKK